jgi:hypothetical protein
MPTHRTYNYRIDILSTKENKNRKMGIAIKDKPKCPNCNKPFDGSDCVNCGFDTYAYDPNWD